MSRLLSEAEELAARALLSQNRDVVDGPVVARLLERETMSGDELMEVVRNTIAIRPAAAPAKS